MDGILTILLVGIVGAVAYMAGVSRADQQWRDRTGYDIERKHPFAKLGDFRQVDANASTGNTETVTG